MEGRFNKRTDSDLSQANIKPGVDIYGVEGSYGGLNVSVYPICIGYSVYDNDGESISTSVSGRLYDATTKIIGIGYLTTRVQSYGQTPFYFEINKTTKNIENVSRVYVNPPDSSGNRGNITMKIASVGGVNRYGFITSSLSKCYYYDGSSIVPGTYATFNAGTTVGSSTLSYLSKTLSFSASGYARDSGSNSIGGATALLNFS